MKHELSLNFEQLPVRIEYEDGEVYFNANDVCEILGYANSRDALRDHVEDPYVVKRDVRVVTGKKADGSDAIQDVRANFVTEPGLYALIFGSHKPKAEVFRDWVFSEVIPSIRKTGQYRVEQPAPVEQVKLSPDELLTTLQAIVDGGFQSEQVVNLQQLRQILLQGVQLPNLHKQLITANNKRLKPLDCADFGRVLDTLQASLLSAQLGAGCSELVMFNLLSLVRQARTTAEHNQGLVDALVKQTSDLLQVVNTHSSNFAAVSGKLKSQEDLIEVLKGQVQSQARLIEKLL